MVTIKKIFILTALSLPFLSGCDTISGTQFDDLSNVNTGQKVLIEEFTGQQCGNCPDGSRTIQSLLDKYGDKIIPVSIHAGYFAEPETKGSRYRYDFRTVAGDALNKQFQVDNSNGYPCAFINRTVSNGSAILGRGAWAGKIETILHTIPRISMNITNTFDTASKEVSIKVNIKYLKTGSSDDQLTVYVTEDSIINWQTDNSRQNLGKDSVNVPKYVHKHVLRGAVVVGDPLTSSDIIVKDVTITKSYTFKLYRTTNSEGVTIPREDFKPKHCHVVAFINSKKNNLDVAQAAEADVIAGQ